jgi:hypothetical protein
MDAARDDKSQSPPFRVDDLDTACVGAESLDGCIEDVTKGAG